MASRGVNKVIILGNLGNDPEVHALPNGGNVATISVATSETWKDKTTQENREKTEWHRISIFGKLADIAAQYLKKGSQVYIEGQLQTRKWQDQQGQDRYSTEIVVQGFNGVLQMTGGNGQQGQQPAGQQQQPAGQPQQAPAQQQQQAPAQQPPMQQLPPNGLDEEDDDIPF